MAALNADVLRVVFEHAPHVAGDPAATLASCALVCKEWHGQAQSRLWADIATACRHDGYYVPAMLGAIHADPTLGLCVRALNITAPLEGALWSSQFSTEGDVMAALIRACPNVTEITVPSFELASRDNVLDALRSARHVETFRVRVYLESTRRSPRFSRLIPFFDWTAEVLSELFTHWPSLSHFDVRHIPADAYHLRPDIVLAPPATREWSPPPMAGSLRRLHLRETYIDDRTLFALVGSSQLAELTLQSCQGITSSAITRDGLLQVVRASATSLVSLSLMTPWLADEVEGPRLVVDAAIALCTRLRHLTVAGWDVSDAGLIALPPSNRLVSLGITDFEGLTPHGLFEALRTPAFAKLERLVVWQRNGGVTSSGARISRGWSQRLFQSGKGRLLAALQSANVGVATAWESTLLSSGDDNLRFVHAKDIAQLDPGLAPTSPV